MKLSKSTLENQMETMDKFCGTKSEKNNQHTCDKMINHERGRVWMERVERGRVCGEPPTAVKS